MKLFLSSAPCTRPLLFDLSLEDCPATKLLSSHFAPSSWRGLASRTLQQSNRIKIKSWKVKTCLHKTSEMFCYVRILLCSDISDWLSVLTKWNQVSWHFYTLPLISIPWLLFRRLESYYFKKRCTSIFHLQNLRTFFMVSQWSQNSLLSAFILFHLLIFFCSILWCNMNHIYILLSKLILLAIVAVWRN